MKKFISFFIVLFLSGVAFAQMDILPPQPVSPDDGDDDQSLDVTMDWLAVAGIGTITYELQYDLDDQFSDPVSIMTEFTSAKAENLLFDTTYYWRVRATDNTGTSNWSDVFHFLTFVQLTLSDPDDEDTDIFPRMEIEWRVKYAGQALTGNDFYEYEVAYDTAFENIYRHGFEPWQEITTGNDQTKVITLLHFDTTYYWRVRTGHEVDTSIWSETWSFSTLQSVTHDLPDDGATGQMLDVMLHWEEVEGAFEYIYELCEDPSFNTPCIFYSDENSAMADGLLLFGKTYYWRVKAAHTEDTTDWSEAWSFETLNDVALVSPENGSFVDDMFPTLTWQEVTGVSGFVLQYDVDENFSEPTTDSIDGDKFSHKVLFSLEYDETYYWRIKAYQTGDTTQWSEVWSFTIGEVGIDELLSEQNVRVFPNPASTELTLEINAIRNTPVEMDVLNVLGQTVLRRQFELNPGKSSYTFPIHQLDDGLYIIQLRSDDDTLMRKIVIEQ